jgi:SRSO17 transposase
MPDILEHPDAQALLEQTTVDAADVAACTRRLTAFLKRYLPLFYRDEQRQHADALLRGKLTSLERKTTEPIARQTQLKRRPLQHFVGAGKWDDHAVRAELRRHVQQELADDDAVLVLDGYGVPKKGEDSCGVARQWCGHLGKVDNCQVGYFLAYVAVHGKALLDAQLYLPPDRAGDATHRLKTYVPEDVAFAEGWRLGLALLRRSSPQIRHGWVTDDDEFGRCTDLRGQLRLDKERYARDVPCNTLVRDLSTRRPPSRPGGRARLPAWERADAWAARQAKGRWRTFRLRGGENGPRQVRALQQWVQTKDEDGHVGGRERLVVIRTCEKKPRTWYVLSNAREEVALGRVVQAHGARHGVEELFAEGNGEVGLDHYEVRSWVGWHHHMTLSLLALWFLQLERLRLGEKNASDDGLTGTCDLHGIAATATAHDGGDCGDRQRGAAA